MRGSIWNILKWSKWINLNLFYDNFAKNEVSGPGWSVARWPSRSIFKSYWRVLNFIQYRQFNIWANSNSGQRGRSGQTVSSPSIFLRRKEIQNEALGIFSGVRASRRSGEFPRENQLQNRNTMFELQMRRKVQVLWRLRQLHTWY